ncbi:MAG: HEAT repeat domain-containing protein [Myxococcales bacterium]|nr:HEAT repeat domain-containing protein [Myxococcota bacterium]MDW8284293.1 HEAT repeat domain-containing protein [Myxococcales bacterium]
MVNRGLELLKKGDVRSICEGAMLLRKVGGQEAIEALLPHLRSRVEQVRDCVREALDRMDVAPVLMGWWHGADAEKRRQALEYAVGLSHPGLLVLYQEAAQSRDAVQRKQAAIGLKRQGRSAEVYRLLAALVADDDRDVRWWAIDSLGVLGGTEAVRVLRERQPAEQDPALKKFIEKALR